MEVTNTTIVEYHVDNENGNPDDDDYGIIYDRLNLVGTAERLNVQLRMDGSYFYEPPTDSYQNDGRPERLLVNYKLDDWTFDGGDFSQQLGRGLVLSMRSVEGSGRDISVRGGRVEYSGDNRRVLTFAGIANTANLDSVSQVFVSDANDLLAGGMFESRDFNGVILQTFGVFASPDEEILGDRSQSVSGGVSADMPTIAPWAGLFLEADAQMRSQAGISQEGWAAYATTDLFAGDSAFLIEALALSSFEQFGSENSALENRFIYNQPPTLERIDQEVLNNRDTYGARVRAEHFFFTSEVLIYANVMYRQNDPGEASTVEQIHVFSGMEWGYGGASILKAAVGYRDETQMSGTTVKAMIHSELDWLQALSADYSLHFQVFHEERIEPGYQRGSSFFGIDRKGLGGLTFEFGYDTQNQAPGVANTFYAGFLSWEPSEALTIRTVVGTQRGGVKCISGVCRTFPEFAGGRLEVIGRF